MAKRTARTITKPSQKVSKTSFKSIKKQAKQRTAAEKGATKMVAPPSAPNCDANRTSSSGGGAFPGVGRMVYAHEATARRRAQNEIDDDPRKD